MKTLLALADSYIVSRDWKMLALVKFCLASVGLLLGWECLPGTGKPPPGRGCSCSWPPGRP